MIKEVLNPLLTADLWRHGQSPDVPKEEIDFFNLPIYKDNKIVLTYKLLKYLISKNYINIEMKYPDYNQLPYFRSMFN